MIKKIAVKIIVAVLLTVIINLLGITMMPILSNDIAIDQLKNDDSYFIAMQAWTQIQSYFSMTTGLVWVACGALIGRDIYKYNKNKIKNGETE